MTHQSSLGKTAVFLTHIFFFFQSECHDQKHGSIGTPLKLNFPQSQRDSLRSPSIDPTVWFKPDPSTALKNQYIILQCMKNGSTDANYELKLKYGSKWLQYSFKKQTKIIESRIPFDWLNLQNWMRFSLRNSKFSLQFRKEQQIMEISLGGYEVRLFNLFFLAAFCKKKKKKKISCVITWKTIICYTKQ